MKDKIEAAITMLKGPGHTVQPQVRGKRGTMWFEVDCRMLVSWEEMQRFADGVYKRRQAKEQSTKL